MFKSFHEEMLEQAFPGETLGVSQRLGTSWLGQCLFLRFHNLITSSSCVSGHLHRASSKSFSTPPPPRLWSHINIVLKSIYKDMAGGGGKSPCDLRILLQSYQDHEGLMMSLGED